MFGGSTAGDSLRKLLPPPRSPAPGLATRSLAHSSLRPRAEIRAHGVVLPTRKGRSRTLMGAVGCFLGSTPTEGQEVQARGERSSAGSLNVCKFHGADLRMAAASPDPFARSQLREEQIRPRALEARSPSWEAGDQTQRHRPTMQGWKALSPEATTPGRRTRQAASSKTPGCRGDALFRRTSSQPGSVLGRGVRDSPAAGNFAREVDLSPWALRRRCAPLQSRPSPARLSSLRFPPCALSSRACGQSPAPPLHGAKVQRPCLKYRSSAGQKCRAL